MIPGTMNGETNNVVDGSGPDSMPHLRISVVEEKTACKPPECSISGRVKATGSKEKIQDVYEEDKLGAHVKWKRYVHSFGHSD